MATFRGVEILHSAVFSAHSIMRPYEGRGWTVMGTIQWNEHRLDEQNETENATRSLVNERGCITKTGQTVPKMRRHA